MGIALLEMKNRIFGLDAQLVFDTCITLIAVFVLFLLMSYLLFKPARELIRKRQEYIKDQLDEAAQAQKVADDMKTEYDAKLQDVGQEAEEILTQARKKAKAKENEIVDEAKEEAFRITARAKKDIELEKARVKDEMKQEMVEVATAMAGRFVEETMDEKKQSELIDETLEKMGDTTWRN